MKRIWTIELRVKGEERPHRYGLFKRREDAEAIANDPNSFEPYRETMDGVPEVKSRVLFEDAEEYQNLQSRHNLPVVWSDERGRYMVTAEDGFNPWEDELPELE